MQAHADITAEKKPQPCGKQPVLQPRRQSEAFRCIAHKLGKIETDQAGQDCQAAGESKGCQCAAAEQQAGPQGGRRSRRA